MLIPVQADVFSLKGLSALNAIIRAIQKRSNPQLKTAGIVINRFNPRTNYSKAIKVMLDNTAQEFDSHVFSNTIRDAVAIREAFAGFEPLFEYDPKGKATSDVDAVLNELEKEIEL
ncbi:ParA family protein [Lactobacillus delbrueckii]|uniref:ParA family protein n=1 Tax=Lactobacillus delbrueckii TaxID=1584 RepID=UPI0022AFF80E|nr:ParA family protein [Lactobacillus delbrueckii]